MRSIVAGQYAANRFEFAELALGVDVELFAGVPGESASERAARLDAAEGMLADLYREDPELAVYAHILLVTAPVPMRQRPRTLAATHAAPVGMAA